MRRKVSRIKDLRIIGGRDHYLGKHGSQESKTKYHRLIGEWNAQGRPSTVVDPRQPSIGLTVGELVLRYWKHAEGYYRKNGRPTDECACIKVALRHVTELYHRTPAADFGPLALKELMISARRWPVVVLPRL